MKIINGGQTEKFKKKISEIKFNPSNSKIEMWIVDSEDNESLSYLNVNEAIKLKNEIIEAVKELL